MLKSIGVKNYRTFPSGYEFDLAPITILLGANSSGKSSITRLLPLFTQSLSQRASGPILWVSDNLDYGSFLDNVHNHDLDGDITFSFAGTMSPPERRRRFSWGSAEMEKVDYKYELSMTGDGNSTAVSSIAINLYGNEVRFPVDWDGVIRSIIVNGEQSDVLDGAQVLVQAGLFPQMYTVKTVALKGASDKPEDTRLEVVSKDIFTKNASKILRNYAHQNTSLEKIQSILFSSDLSSIGDYFLDIEKNSYSVSSLRRQLKNIGHPTKLKIWTLVFLSLLDEIMLGIKNSVSSDISSGAYLGPIRARASRYYRRQELAVDQIDPSGENLAMYLNSLQPYEREEINKDLSRFFGHTIKVHPGEGHISIRIVKDGDTHEDNLADVGFGFSQLLPVIAQVHAAGRPFRRFTPRSSTNQKPESPVLAVEQPELHLHPAYQSKLGAYFVHAATTNTRGAPPFRFLIETHSEPLVNEIASLVAAGKIAAKDVRLYLFERAPGESETKVVQADVQDDGGIPNWPFGFFTSGKIRTPSVNG